MASSSPNNNPNSNTPSRRPSSSDKPRLTEAEKKTNHIVSEQKRRQAIRLGFDRLSIIVPGCEGQGRSEAVVLQATVEYLRAQLARKQELKVRALAMGVREEEFEAAYSFTAEGGDVGELQGNGPSGSGSGGKGGANGSGKRNGYGNGNGNGGHGGASGNGRVKQEER